MVEINLLPPQYRKQTEPSAWRFATWALLPVTVAAILIPELVTATTVHNLENQIADLRGQADSLAPAKREFDTLSRQKAELEAVTNIANQLKEGKTYWTNDLATFTTQLPTGSGVALKSMTMKAVDANNLSSLQQNGIYVGKNVVREIDLTGQASSQQAIVTFLKTFENDPNFGVNFKSMQNEQATGQYTFAASVGVVGAATTPAEPATPVPGAPPAAPTAPAPGSTPSGSVPAGSGGPQTSVQGGGHVN